MTEENIKIMLEYLGSIADSLENINYKLDKIFK